MDYQQAIASFLDRAPIGVFVIDAGGRTFYANPHAMSLLGRGIVPGAGAMDLPEVYQAYREGTDTLYPGEAQPIVRALGGETVTVDDLELRRPDGTRTPLEITAFPILGDDGRVTYAMAAFRDITDRRLAERRERELTDQLRHSQKMDALGRLAGGVAHDFNNLIAVVSGHADLLAASGEVPPDLQPHVEAIRNTVSRARALTGQLLAWARPASADAPVVTDLSTAIREVARMVRPLLSPSIMLEIDTPPRALPVRAGAGQLEQILVNLILNARDALPESGVIAVRADPAGPGQVRLEVRDSGHGMDDDTIGRLFEPFFSTKGEGRGSGLGLAIVHGIVRAAGGSVRVESAPGEGTTFTLIFPEAAAAAPATTVATPAKAPSKLSILVIEDDDALRALVVEMLAKGGYSARSAGTASDAIVEARSAPTVDLVLADSVLPTGRGLGLAAKIVEMHPGARVIVMSGREPPDPEVEDLPVIPHRFLQKPFRMDALLRAIREVVGEG